MNNYHETNKAVFLSKVATIKATDDLAFNAEHLLLVKAEYSAFNINCPNRPHWELALGLEKLWAGQSLDW